MPDTDEDMKNTIQQIAHVADLGVLTSYKWLAKGFISNAYDFTTAKGAFVLLQNKPTAAHSSNYRSYYANLKIVETISYDHAPQALYLSDDDQSIVLTKVAGTSAVDVSDRSAEDQQQIAFNIFDALRKLGNVSKTEANRINQSLGLSPIIAVSEDDDCRKYVIDCFEPYKATAPADARTDWITAAMADHQPRPHYPDACFHHGDTSPLNIIVGEDLHITFIDWGGACFYESAPETEDYGLSYTLNHVAVMQDFKERLLRRVCDQGQQQYETFVPRVQNRSKDIKIADIAWAYMMYCRTSSGDIAEPPGQYKQILDQRIAEFEKHFI